MPGGFGGGAMRWPLGAWRLSLFLPLLLSLGCAIAQATSLTDADFRVRGKIAVRDGDQGFSASFDWHQAGERYDIALYGPLGQGHVRLVGDGRRVRVTSRDGVVHEGEDAQALLASALGWSLPVSALRHWVRGRYDPLAPATQERHDEDGNLTAFRQHGWTVALARWRSFPVDVVDASPGRVAPGRIVARHEQRRIAIVCKEWWFD